MQGEIGVTNKKILFGTFQDLSGPTTYHGIMIKSILSVWKKWVNDDLGGIHGRKVDFVVEDNKYDPVLTKKVFNKLIKDHKVFAIISVYGSSPCTIILEDIQREKIPVFTTAAITSKMFDPPKRHLFWYACSDEDNGIMMLDYIVNDLKIKNPRIGIIYQDDEYGKSALKGVNIGAKEYGFRVTAAGYKRNSDKLKTHVRKMKAKRVTHCFFAGFAPIYVNLLREADSVGWKPIFFCDFGSVDPMIFITGKLAHGHYHFINIAMREERVPGWIKLEKLFIEKLGTEVAGGIMNYHLLPMIWVPLSFLTQALQDVGPNLKREKLIDALESIKDFDTGGLGYIEFARNLRKGTHKYRLMKCDSVKKIFIPVTDWRQPSLLWGKR